VKTGCGTLFVAVFALCFGTETSCIYPKHPC
jgi:hypothetical protein